MPPDLPSDLRLIRRLVVVLTSVLIVGVIMIVGLLVTRLGLAPAPLALPDTISLPENVRPEAITFARDWIVVLGDDGAVLLFGRADGVLRHTLTLPEADGS
ncbi:MAG: hypothetical protein EA339_07705 [Rhodobacteraceae bacterium]|nr:MAG: hypothetical protein EA339_07705 [Paracoccaceae bacterium]